MNGSLLANSRFIVGLLLIVAATLLLLFAEGDAAAAFGVTLGVLGLLSIAISRRQ